jgi:hypothetical protein
VIDWSSLLCYAVLPQFILRSIFSRMMIGESLKLNRKWNFLIVADGKLGRNYSRRMSIWASLIILNRSSSWERLIFLLDKQIVQVYSSNQGYRASILERDGRRPIDIFVTQSTFMAEISNWRNQLGSCLLFNSTLTHLTPTPPRYFLFWCDDDNSTFPPIVRDFRRKVTRPWTERV